MTANSRQQQLPPWAPAAKGLHDLAALLARPGQDIHVLDLAGSGIGGRDSTVAVLDSGAGAEFKRRLTDLDEDLAEAQAHNDLGRAERVEGEREALLDELRRATGHAGKDRGLGLSTVERARKAVTARLRDTIGRIEAALPELGSHLDRSIRHRHLLPLPPPNPSRGTFRHGPGLELHKPCHTNLNQLTRSVGSTATVGPGRRPAGVSRCEH